jgi:hypothetical protein
MDSFQSLRGFQMLCGSNACLTMAISGLAFGTLLLLSTILFRANNADHGIIETPMVWMQQKPM